MKYLIIYNSSRRLRHRPRCLSTAITLAEASAGHEGQESMRDRNHTPYLIVVGPLTSRFAPNARDRPRWFIRFDLPGGSTVAGFGSSSCVMSVASRYCRLMMATIHRGGGKRPTRGQANPPTLVGMRLNMHDLVFRSFHRRRRKGHPEPSPFTSSCSDRERAGHPGSGSHPS
jgi:hypothetical protein